MSTYQKVTEYINNLNDDDLVELWNNYCDENTMPDSAIYYNDDEFLDNHFSRVSEFARCAGYGDYDYRHKWVQFNGCGNLESSDDVSDWVDYSELISYVLNEDTYLELWGIADEEGKE